VFAFAPAANNELKGSGRSITGFHLRDALVALDAEHPGLLKRYGGHAMAAGLSIAASDFERFSQGFEAVAAGRLLPEQLEQKIFSDGELAVEYMNLDVATVLRHAVPWGQAFPEPCFDGSFQLLERRVLKDQHLKLKLKPEPGAAPVDAIAFFQAGSDWSEGHERRIAFHLAVNDFYSRPELQLIVEFIADA
jgi:single-stranded-DNA-specific exonuclease